LFCFGKGLENVLLGSGGKDVIAFFSETGEDFDDLFGGFAGAVDDFRKTAADLAVMVDAGKTQILKGQVAQFLHCLLDVDSTSFDLL